MLQGTLVVAFFMRWRAPVQHPDTHFDPMSVLRERATHVDILGERDDGYTSVTDDASNERFAVVILGEVVDIPEDN